MANLIDIDHLPAIFKEKKFSAFDCLLNPNCKSTNLTVPFHNIFFILFWVVVTILAFKYSPNPLITFFLIGLTMGFIIHMMTDGYLLHGWFHKWYNQADGFKSSLFKI